MSPHGTNAFVHEFVFTYMFYVGLFLIQQMIQLIQSTAFTNSSEPALSTFVTLVEYSLTISDYQTCEQV